MSRTTAPPRIAVIDDEPGNQRLLSAIFTREGYEVVVFASGVTALANLDTRTLDVVVLDLRLPDVSGLDVLAQLLARDATLPILILTSHGDIDSAVQAVKGGAYDFLTRPIDNAVLVAAVQRAVERRRLHDEVGALREQLVSEALHILSSQSAAMRAVIADIQRVAATSMSVLVIGETGTGKELIARAIHETSQRAAAPFVALDCGALPDTLFESELFGYERGAFSGAERSREGYLQVAHGGTLLFDEIGNLSTSNQAKVLRTLQQREVTPLGGRRAIAVDVRVIAATNEQLEGSSARFRADLYYRLAEYVIRVPPLRERRDDVPALANRLVADAALEMHRPVVQLSADAVELLQGHAWPGNVRELRNVIRQAVLRASGPRVDGEELARVMTGMSKVSVRLHAAAGSSSLKEIADAASSEAEREAIVFALRACRGNKTQAARQLHVD